MTFMFCHCKVSNHVNCASHLVQPQTLVAFDNLYMQDMSQLYRFLSRLSSVRPLYIFDLDCEAIWWRYCSSEECRHEQFWSMSNNGIKHAKNTCAFPIQST